MTLPSQMKNVAALFVLSVGLPIWAFGQDSDVSITEKQTSGGARYSLALPRPDADELLASASLNIAVESDRLAIESVKLLAVGKFTEASERINKALKIRLDRSYYHLINGLIYHLQTRNGGDATYDLAEQGYNQAIQFDGSNWLAHYFAGLLSIDTSKFDAASQHLAEALYLHPDDAGVLNAFAYASYRAGSPEQAAGAINAMEAMGGTRTAGELRNAALIMAAVGEQERAQTYLNRLKRLGDAHSAELVERRLADWRDVYSRPRLTNTQFGSPSPFGAPAGAQPLGTPGFGAPGGLPGAPGGAPATAPGTEGKMIVVDVVLISTEEEFAKSRGVNLLRGLQIQFGGSGSPAAQRTFKYDRGSTAQVSITRTITIPSILYNLNIFNSSDNRTEILARPTLVATAGKPSEFFSGSELNAVVVNSSNNSSASPVNIQKEIGTSLQITPNFLPNGQVALKITAARTFIKTPNSNLAGFDARVETAKSKVDANVVMRSGETLILGGLSEKEGESTRDGVPLLQDIPLVQYFASQSTKREYQKSTLILVTPRPAQYVYQPENARQEYEKSLSEDERPFANLRSRYSDWFRPYPNWASVFHALQENPLYREFRTGDVTLENWTDMRSLKDRLKSFIEFLHY